MRPRRRVKHCKIHHMSQIGLLGGGDATTRPTVLRDTEVADNRTLSFDPEWETGGAKFTRSFGQGMIVEDSWFHGNSGGGLWQVPRVGRARPRPEWQGASRLDNRFPPGPGDVVRRDPARGQRSR